MCVLSPLPGSQVLGAASAARGEGDHLAFSIIESTRGLRNVSYAAVYAFLYINNLGWNHRDERVSLDPAFMTII